MSERFIQLLDCTLRDGSYITGSHFGAGAIRGIISKMQEAHADIIECGWLKNSEHVFGTAYYHVPSDLEQYLTDKKKDIDYCVMIDWDRYDTDVLPPYDGKSVDAVRVVFPHGRHKEGIEVGRRIREKGYKVYFQAANTLSYSNEDLHELAACMNAFKPVAISVVDTFGAMYFEDVERLAGLLDAFLDPEIRIGFHAHNNQQLAFANAIHFLNLMKERGRKCVVDASLSGMGRGAGNATTELMTSYLNRKEHGDFDENAVLDAIDTYMEGFHENYSWGYSTPYFIAGLYQTHVNNVAYLLKNHRTTAQDMHGIFASLSEEERRHYDYDLLERKYLENQDRIVDDTEVLARLKAEAEGKTVLLLAPGKTLLTDREKIELFSGKNRVLRIGVNAIVPGYEYDYLFFTNRVRWEYASEAFPEILAETNKILLSNIKTEGAEDELIVNFNRVIKRGWAHFDNAVILLLRLLQRIEAKDVAIAGFDGFRNAYNESYADESLPTLNPDGDWDGLNAEILDMFRDFKVSTEGKMKIRFVTESYFNQ